MACREAHLDKKRVQSIRAGFVAQGTSLAAWCRAEGLHRPNVVKALTGEWRGPKANAVVARAIAASTRDA